MIEAGQAVERTLVRLLRSHGRLIRLGPKLEGFKLVRFKAYTNPYNQINALTEGVNLPFAARASGFELRGKKVELNSLTKA